MAGVKNHSETRCGVSRRDFLRGSGAVAAVSALQPPRGAEAEQAGPEVVRGERTITLHVNGQDRTVRVEPRTTLLEVLRYQLDLTGAKPVSRDGVSGASTVLVDGKPISASTTLALAAIGKKIETIESMADHPVTKAFVEHDALQCGFCTPGFVMAVRAFLQQHPTATEAEIRAGLNGNICRCGAYANIIRAALAVAKGG